MEYNDSSEFDKEIQEIKIRYLKRNAIPEDKYSMFSNHTFMIVQELERKIIKIFSRHNLLPVNDKKLLEIGCGSGKDLLQFMKLGFDPKNLIGNELLEERIESARKILPTSLTLIQNDSLSLNFPAETFDIIYQSMVFSSILNQNYKLTLAKKMWYWVKPGGGVLWYDFSYDNPFNHDVKGVKFSEIKSLFPNGEIKRYRITLAPPLARFVVKIHPFFYKILYLMPLLRSHWLCWIKKPI